MGPLAIFNLVLALAFFELSVHLCPCLGDSVFEGPWVLHGAILYVQALQELELRSAALLRALKHLLCLLNWASLFTVRLLYGHQAHHVLYSGSVLWHPLAQHPLCLELSALHL